MNFRITLTHLFFAGLLAGCGNPLGSVSKIEGGHSPGLASPVSIKPANGAEFVSSSGQLVQTSTKRFQISSSVASPTQEVRVVTGRGYTIYSNVQGSLVSQ